MIYRESAAPDCDHRHLVRLRFSEERGRWLYSYRLHCAICGYDFPYLGHYTVSCADEERPEWSDEDSTQVVYLRVRSKIIMLGSRAMRCCYHTHTRVITTEHIQVVGLDFPTLQMMKICKDDRCRDVWFEHNEIGLSRGTLLRYNNFVRALKRWFK
jgi:hypothetical protein